MYVFKSCGEKYANLCRVYKLIMVSRVPGYGHLEYLVLGLSCWSNHSKLICWFSWWCLIGIMLEEPSQCLSTTMIVKQNLFPCCRKKLALCKNCNHRAFHQPYMHVVIAFILFINLCVTLPAYFMCWPISGCNISCCRLFRRWVRCLRSWSFTQWCRWSWWTRFIFQAFRFYRI